MSKQPKATKRVRVVGTVTRYDKNFTTYSWQTMTQTCHVQLPGGAMVIDVPCTGMEIRGHEQLEITVRKLPAQTPKEVGGE